MLSAKQNRELTQVGPGTPGGALFRSYWLPIGVPLQLERRNPLPVEVLGEKLALFRDTSGALGLVSDRCAHRGTSLSEGSDALHTGGRIDKCGLRCPYHGWLYGSDGQCLDQPGEPAGSKFHSRIAIKAYRVEERYGLIWAYLGEGEPPIIPPIDAAADPTGYHLNTVGVWECNFMQICDNMADPMHVTVLHSDTDFDTEQFRALPVIDVEPTKMGMRITSGRPGYVRQSEFIFPSGIRIALPFMDPAIRMMFFTTPINDYQTLSVHAWHLPLKVGTSAADREEKIAKLHKFLYEFGDSDPVYHETKIARQDKFACASQGALTDRTTEHLGESDVGVRLMRQLFVQAMQDVKKGQTPRGVLREASADLIAFDNVN